MAADPSVFLKFKDVFGDETHFFTELAAFGEVKDDLPEEQNPDCLGKLFFENRSVKHFEGKLLSVAEQAYLAVFIETYHEPDF